MVPRTDNKKNLVVPGQPVEEAGQRAQGAIEKAVGNTNGEVDDSNLRRDWRFDSFTFEEATDCAVEQVSDQDVFGNCLMQVPPIARIRLQNGANVKRPRERGLIGREVSIEDQRGHRCAVASLVGRISCLEVVRIIHDEATLKPAMPLERQAIKQGYDRPSCRGSHIQRTLLGLAFVIRSHGGHLAARAEELDLFALNEFRVDIGVIEQRTDRSDRYTDEQRMVSDLFDDSFMENFTTLGDNKACHSFAGGLSLLGILAVPELDLTRNNLLSVTDALLPILEDPCFEQTVANAPRSHVTQLLEENPPSSKTTREVLACLPKSPKRQHLAQSSLVGEDHKQPAAERLVRSRSRVLIKSEEVIVGWDFLFFNLAQPLHTGDLLYSSDEALYRSDGFQNNHFFGDQPLGFCLEPCSPRFKRPLQILEARG